MSASSDRQPFTTTLIDGYNLMYALGLVQPAGGEGHLERSRAALLGLLARSLPGEDLGGVVVVFDAERPPPGAPSTQSVHGMTVHFATGHEDADALIEELIAAHHAPRRLTVVSSDHRLHRAARRRRAKAIDSDAWFDRLRRDRARRQPPPAPNKPAPPAGDETEYWLREFGAAAAADLSEPGEQEPPRPAKRPPPADDAVDPFPPGYFDDLPEDL